MNYLAIDASTEACSVALNFNDKIYHQFELCPQSHSTVLLPMIDSILTQAGCQLSELNGLIFGRGPGSFTGVRIGIGVVQGLAFSAELEVVGVSTLRTMAQQAYELYQRKRVVAAIDARMSEVYTGYFSVNAQGIMEQHLPEAVMPPSELVNYLKGLEIPVYGVGTGWDAYPADLSSLKINEDSPEILYPDARFMLKIGIEDFKKGLAVSAELAQPVYVRDTVSWKKLPGR
ncbi:tRNA (adenosine(37)-N6)-threonylcarbamoyltransferase complex dimerization subunit type 1 TsaB [Thalassotalea profundi]|uniref:tRNA threonylcarbamoyladenosine biosynthesis protein TsaB n=1 Tax=Thalassotalea profundi TaxID=2036687 RepID=A0ABQ3IFK2_9GAMM|nr:tRNA (adenosine(37)-N6)-threonylcarbamoyltransferase complex dimerization subunit type 1 TsaB [Thalassotalea profundi]GHE78523.1 tRNA (adenosine(37)-N6)-threonylcarbamoyltransferase complex dimerization subunit type 1 TsaB [Thalassotalea profundi]